jgi:hypothetical protein
MKSGKKSDAALPCVSDFAGEPLERLEQRALEGVVFGIAALRRLRRRLPKWLRPGGKIDPARAIAAVTAVNTALATVSPVHLKEMARGIRRQLKEAGLSDE